MKLKCQKYSENSKEMTFFSDVLCLSRPYLSGNSRPVDARLLYFIYTHSMPSQKMA